MIYSIFFAKQIVLVTQCTRNGRALCKQALGFDVDDNGSGHTPGILILFNRMCSRGAYLCFLLNRISKLYVYLEL